MKQTKTTHETADLEVLEAILTKLVNYPEDIKIVRKIDERGVLILITVNPKDMGIVIGREGKMVKAIRFVIQGVGLANNMNVRVYFLEADGTFKYSDKILNQRELDVINEEKQNIQNSVTDSDEFALN